MVCSYIFYREEKNQGTCDGGMLSSVGLAHVEYRLRREVALSMPVEHIQAKVLPLMPIT